MSKFTSTVTLDMWYRGLWEFSGPAGTVFSIPDSLYEEFNEEFGHGVIPGLVWTEIVSEAASGVTVGEIDGSPSTSGITSLVFSNGAVAISGNTATVTTSSVTGITVAEVDGSPSSAGVTTLVLPNTTVSISGSTATYTPAVPASGITVAEIDGSPSSSGITSLFLPNGTVAISGSSATYTPSSSGGLAVSRIGSSSANTATTPESVASLLALKQIVCPSAGVIVSVMGYIDQNSDASINPWAMVYDDVGGNPVHLLSLQGGANNANTGGPNMWLETGAGSGFTARWMSFPVGIYVAAGTYWIGLGFTGAGSPRLYGASPSVASDKHNSYSGFGASDFARLNGLVTPSAPHDHAIYAVFLS
jgi:hypothetical protein